MVSRFSDGEGREWQQDDYNTGGTAYSISEADLLDTNAGLLPMYATELNGGRSHPDVAYALPLASGSYRLRLHWAEIFNGASIPGERLFNVFVENVEVLHNFDIVARYGYLVGRYEEIDVTVTDGTLNIRIDRVKRSPKINGIEVLALTSTPAASTTATTTTTPASTSTTTSAKPTTHPTTTPSKSTTTTSTTTSTSTTVSTTTEPFTTAQPDVTTAFAVGTTFLREVAINAGGVEGDYQSPGHSSLDWSGDADFVYTANGFQYQVSEDVVTLPDLATYGFLHGSLDEQRASLQYMYSRERTAGRDDSLTYAVPLPGGPGMRRVRLHFAELLDTSAAIGDRLMDIFMEDSLIFLQFDTVASFGFRRGGFLEIDVDIADGILNVGIFRVKKVSACTIRSESRSGFGPNRRSPEYQRQC